MIALFTGLLAAACGDAVAPERANPVTALAGQDVIALAGQPAPIDSLSATVISASRVDIHWSDTISNHTHYVVHRRTRYVQDGVLRWTPWLELLQIHKNRKRATDAVAIAGYLSGYRVRACNNEGCSLPVIVNVTVPTLPAPPGVAFAPTTATTATVSWTDADPTVTTFILERSELVGMNWSPYAPHGVFGGSATNFGDTGLVIGGMYTYALRACNLVGCSAPAIVKGTIPFIPEKPANLNGYASGLAVVLGWNDESNNETHFQIERRLRNGDSSWGAYGTVASPAAGATGHTDSGLMQLREYQYRLRSCNTSGCSTAIGIPPIVTPIGGELDRNPTVAPRRSGPDSRR